MDAFDVVIKQLDEKVEQLRDYLADGKAESFEDYKRLCGEIRGLLTARGYMKDLKQKLESLDE